MNGVIIVYDRTGVIFKLRETHEWTKRTRCESNSGKQIYDMYLGAALLLASWNTRVSWRRSGGHLPGAWKQMEHNKSGGFTWIKEESWQMMTKISASTRNWFNPCLDNALPLASCKHSCCDGEVEGTFQAGETQKKPKCQQIQRHCKIHGNKDGKNTWLQNWFNLYLDAALPLAAYTAIVVTAQWRAPPRCNNVHRWTPNDQVNRSKIQNKTRPCGPGGWPATNRTINKCCDGEVEATLPGYKTTEQMFH